MGRHRSDPLGIARLALVGLAVVLLLALVVIGAKALLSSLGAGGAPATGGSSSAPVATRQASSARVPTLQVVCQADRCPVFVRVPGGDVLMDRDMTRSEQASYFEPELYVVLGDGSMVRVLENGTPRAPGQPGERESFKVTRSPGQ